MELHQLVISYDRTEYHVRKRGGDSRFARQAHSQAQRNEMHQGLAPDIELLHFWCVAAIREAFCEPLTNRGTMLRLAGDEEFLAKYLPFDLLLVAQDVTMRKNNEKTLLPQRRHVAIRGAGRIYDKPDIQLSPPNERDLLRRGTFVDLNAHIGM